MTVKRIQAPHRMKCENCDVGFAKLVKSDELIDGEKHCVYYCEHCKNYKLYKQVERPKRFTRTTSRGLYCWDNITGKRYDAVDDFFEMVDLLDALHDENEQLKEQIKELQIENEAQSDAIDGLQELLAHMDLGDVE